MALQLFFSENITYIYLGGRKRMPRGAAEIGLPFRHKRVLEIYNTVAKKLYN
jgi:hypothetical protein